MIATRKRRAVASPPTRSRRAVAPNTTSSHADKSSGGSPAPPPKTSSSPSRRDGRPVQGLDGVDSTNEAARLSVKMIKPRASPVVEFRSVLRIRPLTPEEVASGDEIVLSKTVDSGDHEGAPVVALRRPSKNDEASPGTPPRSQRSHYRPSPSMSSPPSSHKRLSPVVLSDEIGGSVSDNQDNAGTFFRFDSVLDPDTTQDIFYASEGSVLAHDALKPLMQVTEHSEHEVDARGRWRDHVVISLGVSNSGKTHTVFGSEKIGAKDPLGHKLEEGLLPRLIDNLFAQFQRNGRAEDGLSFAVRLSMSYVHNDKVYDMLSSYSYNGSVASPEERAGSSGRHGGPSSAVRRIVASYERSTSATSVSVTKIASNAKYSFHEKTTKEIKIHRDAASGNSAVNPNIITCTSAISARRALRCGLDWSVTSATAVNAQGSRGHIIVSFHPILMKGNDTSVCGGKITVIDTAGIERTRKSLVSGHSLRESAAINSSVHGVLQCLRAIKHNHSGNEREERKPMAVPYRQGRLTMLLQPLFSSSPATTKICVTLLVSASPGAADYAEKKALLTEIESLRGLAVCGSNSSLAKPSVSAERPELCSSSPLPKPVLPSTPDLDSGSSKGNKGWMKRSPLRRISSAVSSSSASKKLMGTPSKAEKKNKLTLLVEQLEEERADLLRENKSLQDKCKELTCQNRDLTSLLKQQSTKEDNEKEERRRVTEREERIRLQNPLSVELQDHMERVKQTARNRPGNLQWRESGQRQIKLKVPDREEWTCSGYYYHQAKRGSMNVLQVMGEALASHNPSLSGANGQAKEDAMEDAEKAKLKNMCNETMKSSDFEL